MSTFPKRREVADLLSGILGKQVAVKLVDAYDLEMPSALGVFVRQDEITGLCVCDLAFANVAGAALSMIPAPIALEVIESGEIADNLLDNLGEILNIGSQWFESGDSSRVWLREVSVLPDEVSEDAGALLATATGRLDYRVSIPGYVEGTITFLH